MVANLWIRCQLNILSIKKAIKISIEDKLSLRINCLRINFSRINCPRINWFRINCCVFDSLASNWGTKIMNFVKLKCPSWSKSILSNQVKNRVRPWVLNSAKFCFIFEFISFALFNNDGIIQKMQLQLSMTSRGHWRLIWTLLVTWVLKTFFVIIIDQDI